MYEFKGDEFSRSDCNIVSAAESVSQRRVEEDFMNAVRDGNTKRINELVRREFFIAHACAFLITNTIKDM